MIESREFLHLAEKLIDRDQWSFVGEENIRTSVSRAYYFIFLKIKEELEGMGVQFQKFEVHKDVADKLKLTTIPAALNVGMRLEALKIKRTQADYHLKLTGYEFGSLSASIAIAEAKEIEGKFDQIDKTELKSKILPQ